MSIPSLGFAGDLPNLLNFVVWAERQFRLRRYLLILNVGWVEPVKPNKHSFNLECWVSFLYPTYFTTSLSLMVE